jgi:hypothetical protein
MIEFGFVFIGGLVIAVFGYAFSRLIIKNGEETHEEDGEEDGEPEEGKARDGKPYADDFRLDREYLNNLPKTPKKTVKKPAKKTVKKPMKKTVKKTVNLKKARHVKRHTLKGARRG